MAFTRVAALLHAALSDVTSAQHHTATVAGDLDLADLNARAHADLSDAPSDAHHAAAHTVLSHSDGSDVCKIATGEYTGDGTTSQAITGVGFTVKYVLIVVKLAVKTTLSAADTGWSTDVIVDDNAGGGIIELLAAGGGFQFEANKVIAFGADGFTVDDAASDLDPNKNAVVYNFIAMGIEV